MNFSTPKTAVDFNNFQLVSILRRSDTEVLYSALDKRDQSNVLVETAIKKQLGTRSKVLEFHEQAGMLAAVSHASLLVPHAFGITPDNYPFFVWLPQTGIDLWGLMESSICLNNNFIIHTFRSMCDALGAADSVGFEHGIIYPYDLLFPPDGKPLLLGGYGRTLLLPDRTSNQVTLLEINEVYRAPELCLGLPADEKTEVYAIGCLIYESFFEKPFKISSSFKRYVVGRTLFDCCEWLQGLPFESITIPEGFRYSRNDKETNPLISILQRCLQVSPAQRYRDISELKAELLSAEVDG
jgi:serine/threonine protein kinase